MTTEPVTQHAFRSYVTAHLDFLSAFEWDELTPYYEAALRHWKYDLDTDLVALRGLERKTLSGIPRLEQPSRLLSIVFSSAAELNAQQMDVAEIEHYSQRILRDLLGLPRDSDKVVTRDELTPLSRTRGKRVMAEDFIPCIDLETSIYAGVPLFLAFIAPLMDSDLRQTSDSLRHLIETHAEAESFNELRARVEDAREARPVYHHGLANALLEVVHHPSAYTEVGLEPRAQIDKAITHLAGVCDIDHAVTPLTYGALRALTRCLAGDRSIWEMYYAEFDRICTIAVRLTPDEIKGDSNWVMLKKSLDPPSAYEIARGDDGVCIVTPDQTCSYGGVRAWSFQENMLQLWLTESSAATHDLDEHFSCEVELMGEFDALEKLRFILAPLEFLNGDAAQALRDRLSNANKR